MEATTVVIVVLTAANPHIPLTPLPNMSDTIIIRHLTGTQKGKDQVINSQEVSLGTGPGSTVRFDPVWDKGVAPSHARVFRDDHGQWVLEDSGTSVGTFVNGQRVATRRIVTGALVIELGRGGPKIEAVLPPSAAESRAVFTNPGNRIVGNSRPGKSPILMVGAVFIGVIVLVSAAWFLVGKTNDNDQRLQQVAKKCEEGIGLVVLAGNGKSVPLGTAWAVGPNMFATNAHVATPVLQALKQGASAFIAINKHPDQRFRVKTAIPHPRYFSREVGMDGKPPVTTPYDVGILIIEGHAGVTLHPAESTKLQALDSGHRIAFLGFPMEDLRNGGVDPQNPVATMQSGIVTSVTDFWLAKSVFDNRRLIQHNLPTVGGSSGSPIFDSDGDVVGILSSGNMIAAMTIDSWAEYQGRIQKAKQEALERTKGAVKSQPEKRSELVAELNATLQALDNVPLPVTDLKRAPSAAMVNYAQRIDMLQELIGLIQEVKQGN